MEQRVHKIMRKLLVNKSKRTTYLEILSSLKILIPSCFANHKVLTKHLFSRQAFLRIRLQHLAHKALSTVRNLRPWFSLEVNHSPQNRQSHPSFVLYTKPKHFTKIQTPHQSPKTQTQQHINNQHLSMRKNTHLPKTEEPHTTKYKESPQHSTHPLLVHNSSSIPLVPYNKDSPQSQKISPLSIH